MTDLSRASRIPWMDDFASKPSTVAPEAQSEMMAIGTLVIIIVSAILSIVLLFGIALFIDIRHQKIAASKRYRPKVKSFQNESVDEEGTFADKMQNPESDPPLASVITT